MTIDICTIYNELFNYVCFTYILMECINVGTADFPSRAQILVKANGL